MRFLVLLALIGAAIAVPRQSQRIAGGEDTTIEVYPYISNMQYGWFGVWWLHACGGSLITNNVILSASHCFIGDPISMWRATLGTSRASSGGIQHQVASILLHPQYDDFTLENDVALIRLSTPATLSNSIGLARIPGPNYNLADRTLLTSVGWGSASTGGTGSIEQLQHVQVNVYNQEACAARYAELKTQPSLQHWPDITPSMLCAGVLDFSNKVACQGDSGGPLVHYGDVVVGITSWGYGCAREVPDVNARTSVYSAWIVANA